MPTLEEVVGKFETWRASGARVQVNWEGFAEVPADQKVMTAQVDGIVEVVEQEGGGTTLVYVGFPGQNNVIRMRLSTGCTFQGLPLPGTEAFAGLESRIRISFPTGEHCFVHFFNPPD